MRTNGAGGPRDGIASRHPASVQSWLLLTKWNMARNTGYWIIQNSPPGFSIIPTSRNLNLWYGKKLAKQWGWLVYVQASFDRWWKTEWASLAGWATRAPCTLCCTEGLGESPTAATPGCGQEQEACAGSHHRYEPGIISGAALHLSAACTCKCTQKRWSKLNEWAFLPEVLLGQRKQ